MQDADISLMNDVENNYWWHVSRRFILQSVLQQRMKKRIGNILDVGCGTGSNLQWLNKFGEATGIDNNLKALSLCGVKNKVILGRADNLPINNMYALITAFDVLEHLEDDKKALKEWKRVVEKGGYLFISVPAYQWLFSSHDKQMMHYRRYNKGQLLQLVKEAGFKPVFSSYFFMFTFPLFVLQRIISKTTKKSFGYIQLPTIINNFFILLGKIEKWLMKYMSLPFGSSILLLAKKDD